MGDEHEDGQTLEDRVANLEGMLSHAFSRISQLESALRDPHAAARARLDAPYIYAQEQRRHGGGLYGTIPTMRGGRYGR